MYQQETRTKSNKKWITWHLKKEDVDDEYKMVQKQKKCIIFLLLREKLYILQSIVCSFKFFHVMNDALTEKIPTTSIKRRVTLYK